MSFNLEQAEQMFSGVFAGLSPAYRLLRVAEYFSSEVVFTTSFGIEDQMITYLIVTEKLPFRIVTLDTGRFFPETYAVWQYTEEKYSLRIRAYYPNEQALEALVADQGINGFYYSPQMRETCCAVRKVEPLSRALKNARAWITGMRRDQSTERRNLNSIILDKKRALLKINPLYDLTRDQVTAFVSAHDIPVNTLHAEGFLSIGCAPCTRSVRHDEDERAGRWWWERDRTKECGLHINPDRDFNTAILRNQTKQV
ncbi:MAG: phosphoadenosine phosphosulfate reductase [Candidatus Tokpelaia sp. JSC188]|nr:MAG: phosphoadenosine phosphosulfate reductase [Candidatus Tokpelaia sp. JSC188]